MKNPDDKYYQIPSKSQLPNPKTKKEKVYDIRERVFCFAQEVLEIIAGKYIKSELLEEDIKEAQEIINILSVIEAVPQLPNNR